MNKGLGPKIKELRELGKTYDEIALELGCAKSSVCYHLGSGQKKKHTKRQTLNRNKRHPYLNKLYTFNENYTHKNIKITKSSFDILIYNKIFNFSRTINNKKTKGTNDMQFSFEDIIEKFGESPKCYLTGDDINIYETSSYHFDHIIPRSKGGDNSLDNLGICTKEANRAKSDMDLSEFYNLCEKIIKNRDNK